MAKLPGVSITLARKASPMFDRMKCLYSGFERVSFLLAQSIAFDGPDSRSTRTGA